MTFKELMIQPTPNGFLPNLPLNGKWLENLGFTVGTGVSLNFVDDCIVLMLNGTDLQVESRNMRRNPRTILTINAFWLKKHGFNLWDRVGLTLEYGKITIQKIVDYSTSESV